MKTHDAPRSLLRCLVVDGRFGLPATGVEFAVYADRSPIPVARGVTGSGGLIDVPGRLTALGALHLRLVDADGHVLSTAQVDPLRAEQELTIPFDRWTTYRRVKPAAPQSSWLGRYSQLATQVQRAAKPHGLDLGPAIDRAVGRASELDQLTSALAAAVEQKPHGLRQLLRMMRGAGAPGGARSRGPAVSAAFAPGVGELFPLAVRLGRSHRGLGRQVLQRMFDLNLDLDPLVRAGRAVQGPGGAVLPPEVIDFRNGVDPGGWPGEMMTDEERAQLRCEVALTEAYDAATRPAQGVTGGGAAASMLTIQPDHEAQTGDRRVTISLYAGADWLAPGATIPVSFPTRNGRESATGTVSSIDDPGTGERIYRIEVYPPVRSIEGVIQVSGLPAECGAHSSVHDAGLQGLLDATATCTGVRHGATVDIGGASCEAQAPNWQGSAPEVHFRWRTNEGIVSGDERRCSGAAKTHVATGGSFVVPAHEAPRERVIDRLPELVGWAVPADEDADGCGHARHESVLYVLDADQPLVFDYLTTNEPEGMTSFAISRPMTGAAGPPAHAINNRWYHVDWKDGMPIDGWTDIGVGSAAGAFAPITIENRWLGPITQSSLQVLRGAATNALGTRQHALEIVRVVKTARVSRLVVRPSDGSEPTGVQRVGPDEIVDIEVSVEMPSFAATGVRGLVVLSLGTERLGTLDFAQASGQTAVLKLAGVDMRNNDVEGRADLTASITYAYTSASQYPGGVALGELIGAGLSLPITVTPRIAILYFLGQWGTPYNQDGSCNADNFGVKLMRSLSARLQDEAPGTVTSSLLTGRIGEGDNGWLSSITEGPFAPPGDSRDLQWGELRQTADPSVSGSPRGGVQMFVSAWGFEEGGNDWGWPQRDWLNEENTDQINFYMDQSRMDAFLRDRFFAGKRRTHYMFCGHSRGGGSCFAIMNWLKRKLPAERRPMSVAIYLDGMHTDGFFQPINSFPVCADTMVNFFATVGIWPKNVEWSTPPNCPGSTFTQIPVARVHGEVPEGDGVLGAVRAVMLGRLRELLP